jgi:excisionase family DNA binding protein
MGTLELKNNEVFLLTKNDLKILLTDLSINKKYLTLSEAAQYIRVSDRTLRNMMKSNKIPFYKPEGKILFKISELDKYIENNKVESLSELIQKATNKGR